MTRQQTDSIASAAFRNAVNALLHSDDNESDSNECCTLDLENPTGESEYSIAGTSSTDPTY